MISGNHSAKIRYFLAGEKKKSSFVMQGLHYIHKEGVLLRVLFLFTGNI
jgi:hypothetical protein